MHKPHNQPHLQNPKSIQPRKRHRHSRGVTRGELLANDSTYVTTTTTTLL